MHCLYCGCFVLLFLLSPLIPCAQRLSDIGNAVLLLYPSFTLHLLTLAKITLLLMTSCDIQEMFGIIDSHCCLTVIVGDLVKLAILVNKVYFRGVSSYILSKRKKVQREFYLREALLKKKNVFFWALPEKGGGGDPCPNFLTLFFHYVVPYILTSISCYVILFGHF